MQRAGSAQSTAFKARNDPRLLFHALIERSKLFWRGDHAGAGHGGKDDFIEELERGRSWLIVLTGVSPK